MDRHEYDVECEQDLSGQFAPGWCVTHSACGMLGAPRTQNVS
jgi:hypothetical protein